MEFDSRGTPVVSRAAALLRAVRGSEPTGESTTALARTAGIARPTAHRLLSMLFEEGFVDRDRRTGHWMLGPEIYFMGSAAAHRYDITAEARDVIVTLARETGESAFLSARRGDETVCVSTEQGTFPLRAHVLHEGIRFPLGVASAGLAILSHLPDSDIDDYLKRSPAFDIRWGAAHSKACIRERIEATRLTGYAVNPALIADASWGIGAAVFDRTGRPGWALSVTGVETRFCGDRRRKIGALLLEQAHVLSTRLQS